ncbi:MAG: hypothetical protein ACF8CQ_01140, partial [Rhodopirellula sp. JB044]|uniref:hypothetical protein n=1 Tax=Rhodopirellula sp. JB044 TaxID=3342844 RepID=UPI00370C70CD
PQPGSEAPAEQPVATMSQPGMQEIQFEEGPGMGPGMGGGPDVNAGPQMNAGPDMNAGPGFAAGPMNDLRMSPPAEAHVEDSHAEPDMISGPAMNSGAALDAGRSLYGAGPMDAGVPVPGDAPMDMGGPVHPAPAAQGLVGDFGQPPAQTFGNNSLRQPAGGENQLRSGAPRSDLRQPALPSLPEPNLVRDTAGQTPSVYGQQEPYGQTQPNNQTPAQFAGHQRDGRSGMGLPNNMTPNQRNAGGYAPEPYLAGGGDPIAISQPGDRRLEGVQTPSVVIHKRAPAEVKVGRPATFVIQVRNVGTAEALGVLVHDRVPAGMKLVDATPQPVMQGDLLVWQLGAMPAGDERSITMQLIPQEEGELGSVARVTFEAAASVRTRSTRPELKVTQRAPAKVLIGQQLEIELEVANVGTGEATGVILQADVPPGLDHPRGRQLDNALGSLRPGEVRREVLRMRAAEPGMIENVVHLVAEDAEAVSHSVSVEIVAPNINVALTGPSRRFLERQATYMVNIENRGTAPATNVEIVARLDRGFTFVGTENNGHYDPNRHAVLWSIVDLPAGDVASVPVTLLPVEAGDQVIRLEASADLNARSEVENTVSVESQAELTFSIADTADPIELGSETTYEIKVRNSGSRNDTNVQVQMLLPPGIEMLGSDADAGTDGRGGVMFAPHGNLPAGEELVYRVKVRGVQPDTHVIKAVVTSDQSRVPVTKEESTMVYADR